ncbi:hypothetical protein AKJ57_00250 [candidate division MSBL1 archaeon SCGC-AAA259A05]|uniref:ABC transmembrane type-1 domain-containing protein n=1 Tax=candidate division MSBL1 archaeon SCGC-AAA259A05 TaxID=1698259 RepID=A0A133UBW8_9EURY|nr:hypothetical protein AKJ57_00250 [candidate division MSBL1 archaeon SCGC-AAA259A05]
MKEIIQKIKDNPFVAFAGKKLIFLFISFFIAMTILFVLSHMMPSNPAQIMSEKVGASGMEQSISQSTLLTPGQGTKIEVLRQIYTVKFGINKSLGEQYVVFWKRFLTMDYGYSFWRYPHSVSSLVINALPWTMALVLPVVPIGFIVGNWIGSRAAYYRGKFDRTLYYISMYLWRAPYFWFALILVLVFGSWLGWFPIAGSFGKQFIRPEFSWSGL